MTTEVKTNNWRSSQSKLRCEKVDRSSKEIIQVVGSSLWVKVGRGILNRADFIWDYLIDEVNDAK